MIEILISSVLSSIFISSYGNFFCKIFFSQNYSKNLLLSEKSLIGIIFLTFISIILNFFTPLNELICSIIFLIGIFLSFKNKIYYDYKLLLITSFISLILVSYSNINRPDAGLYHLPIISMLNESKIILGSANLHFRFAHGSIIQNFSSLYNIYFLSLNFITISIASIFSFFLYFLYEKFSFTLKQGNKNLSFLYTFTFVFLVYSFNRYSGYGNDAIAHIFFIYLFFLFLNFKFDSSINHDEFLKTLLISIFLVGLKLFMILTLAIPLILLFKFKPKLKLFKSISTYICLLFIISFSLKSILTSGCVFYPLEITCIKSMKIFNKNQLVNTSEMSEAWSKGWPDQEKAAKDYSTYNNNFVWIETWKDNHFKFIKKKISPYIIFLILILFYFFIIREKVLHKEKSFNEFSFKDLFIILAFLIFCNLIWFFKFPLYRFGISFLYCLILILFVIFAKDIIKFVPVKKLKNFSILLILVSLTGFITKNSLRIIKANTFGSNEIWPQIIPLENIEKVKIDNNGYYYFSSSSQCMYSSSPCTYYRPKNLMFSTFLNYKIFWIKS